jgi:hypothetical protein
VDGPDQSGSNKEPGSTTKCRVVMYGCVGDGGRHCGRSVLAAEGSRVQGTIRRLQRRSGEMAGRLFLTLALCQMIVYSSASADPCFMDPSKSNCVDAAVYYNDVARQTDLEAVCNERPWTTGCSLWRKCGNGEATGKFCTSWNMLVQVCSDKAVAGASGCDHYRQLCVASTVVKQCKEDTGVPNFIQTAVAIDGMQSLCTDMPGMQWCSACTSSGNPASTCKDALTSISELCLDHYMAGCSPWYEMCKTYPPGLAVICGADSSEGVGAVGDDGLACYGQMKMFFHGGMSDYILFESWVPCTSGNYVSTLFAILLVGIFRCVCMCAVHGVLASQKVGVPSFI